MPRVIWFELSADQPKKVMDFYSKVFGWKFERYQDQEYWIVTSGGKEEPGIDGAIQPKRTKAASVVNTIGVSNIDETIKKIEKNGGKVVAPKMEIPMMGTLAYFEDTEGNKHGIMQVAPRMKK
ncbi:MAG: VOC family protein [Methanomassiliicoccales archaeon]|nr:VOC family protein [Methanomassiliicoccales archaeon]